MGSLEADSITHRYQIRKKLGEGGMAVVYRAFDTNLERDVAIKIIKGNKLESGNVDQMIKRFEREVKTLAKLTHPNIVHIHDYGRYQVKPFLIMEYLPGGTLEGRMKAGKLPYQEAAQILLPIAEALRYAHQQGILHRDVKPANILFSDDGKALLSDFGIAKIFGTNSVDKTESLTQTGMGLGTPEYMAPEQWHGQFSMQTDIYALGIVFYELITGRKPFIAETPAAFLLKQMMEEPPHPAEFVEGLPTSVSNFIFKALEKEQEDRFADMDEVIQELRRFGSGEVGEAAVYQRSEPAWKQKLSSSEQMLVETEQDEETKKNTAAKKIARGFGRVIQQIIITLVIVAVVLAILAVIGSVYVTGLFTRQAIQNAFYEDILQEETYRMTEESLNFMLDENLMPYFADFADDIDADISFPNNLDLTLYRLDSEYTLQINVEEKNGYPQFNVRRLNDSPLLFVRGILSAQINRGMKKVLDDNDLQVTKLVITDDEINYTVSPRP